MSERKEEEKQSPLSASDIQNLLKAHSEFAGSFTEAAPAADSLTGAGETVSETDSLTGAGETAGAGGGSLMGMLSRGLGKVATEVAPYAAPIAAVGYVYSQLIAGQGKVADGQFDPSKTGGMSGAGGGEMQGNEGSGKFLEKMEGHLKTLAMSGINVKNPAKPPIEGSNLGQTP